MAADAPNGALLGGEEALVAKLCVSRATLRQVARLLEREGLLRVRRGVNGGYFAARPDEQTIENAASAYLDTLDMDAEDVTVVAAVLWVEAMRKAASLRTKAARNVAETLRQKVASLKADATISEVTQLEQYTRSAIFDLIKGRYIELIFHINMAFAKRRFPVPRKLDAEAHHAFVEAWRTAKELELTAIAEGDPELGVLAARRARNLWHRYVWEPAKASTKARK